MIPPKKSETDPSVTRVFRQDQNMFVYLAAYQPRCSDHAVDGRYGFLRSWKGQGH
jgi:hypothetical protein